MGPLTGGRHLSFSHGPPASDKQVAYLLALLNKAGHAGFRDARHPLGLTQRQASGKFTRNEASDLIERLLESDGTPPTNERPWSQPTLDVTSAAVDETSATVDDRAARDPAAQQTADLADELARLRHLPADVLATELTRRGWSVTPPPPAGRR